jgi:hypothetical protein
MKRETIIETMARAALGAELPPEFEIAETVMELVDGEDYTPERVMQIAMQAALTALEALGLAVVPREPTEAMCVAGVSETMSDADQCDAAHIYRAMLAAAPLPAAPNEAARES